MNILIITAVGGFLPKFLMQDVNMLMSRGHTVCYATNFENPVYECNKADLESMGIKCYQIPIAKSPISIKSNIKAYRELKRIVRNDQIDAVYAHNPMGGMLGRFLTFFKKELKVIYTAHGFHFYKGAPLFNWMFFYPAEKFMARRTNVLLTINTEDREQAEKLRIRKGGIVRQIPGTGVDFDRFHPDKTRRDDLRDKFGIKPEDFVFLSVGELNDNKNHETTIKAFSALNMPETKLFICGEGPSNWRLAKLIQRLRQDSKITCWGYRTNIEEYYIAADAFVFPSTREGLGMAAIEAMASGLPLIVADNRGSREYAGENAIVCNPTDINAFTEAMRELASDKERCERMAEISLETAVRFSKERTKVVMKEVFEKLEEGNEP